jgi:3-methyladenine DNA glycosylase AlkD
MKSVMPYAGVKVPEMRRIAKSLLDEHPFDTDAVAHDACLTLWDRAKFREERYVAIELLLARRYAPLRAFERLALTEHLIVTGAWWDYVDSIAPAVFGPLLIDDRRRTVSLLEQWSTDDDLWKRRSALLSQLRLKRDTDESLLFRFIEPSLDSSEFFLRKAIGWALREYSKTAPQSVSRYVKAHESRLSPLSRREALKVIERG